MTCKICYGIASRDSFGLVHCRSCGADHLTSRITWSRNPRKVIVRAKGAISIGYPTVRAKLQSKTVDAN